MEHSITCIRHVLQQVVASCSRLQQVAAGCSKLQQVAASCSKLRRIYHAK